jgi:hypothetical protein
MREHSERSELSTGCLLRAGSAHTRASLAVGSAPLDPRRAIAGLPPPKIGQSEMLPLACPSFGALSVDSFSPPRFPARPAARQPRPRLPCYPASAARPPLAPPRAPFCRRAPHSAERLLRVQVAPRPAVCRLQEVPTFLAKEVFSNVSWPNAEVLARTSCGNAGCVAFELSRQEKDKRRSLTWRTKFPG